MKINHFQNINTLEELKSAYRKLAKQYHPDINKAPEALQIMKEINTEYEYLAQQLKNERGYTETKQQANDFISIIDQLLKYNNIEVEIIGTWLWVRGKGTFAIKDFLQDTLGMIYTKSHKAFYWYAGCVKKVKRSSKQSIEKIRDKYGSVIVKSDNDNNFTPSPIM